MGNSTSSGQPYNFGTSQEIIHHKNYKVLGKSKSLHTSYQPIAQSKFKCGTIQKSRQEGPKGLLENLLPVHHLHHNIQSTIPGCGDVTLISVVFLSEIHVFLAVILPLHA